MAVYYNENDDFAAAWLEELIKEGLIAYGIVDKRSICDVQPEDLRGFAQHHFFAGIGGWSYALRLAGYPDDKPIWTGSCPCQPFSVAGKRKGTADKRHLWPEFRRLIAECRPSVVAGEQVAAKDGRIWLAGVRADLEALGYAVGATDLCAAGVSAPHIRQRLYWVADARCERSAGRRDISDLERAQDSDESASEERQRIRNTTDHSGPDGRVADSNGRFASDGHLQRSGQHGQQPQNSCVGKRVADSERDTGDARRVTEQPGESDGAAPTGSCAELGRCGDIGGLGYHHHHHQGLEGRSLRGSECSDQFTPWGASTFIRCLDGKRRRVPANEAGEPEPSLFPLAYGVSNRVGILRGAGNAIVPQVAAEFIKAYLDIRPFFA